MEYFPTRLKTPSICYFRREVEHLLAQNIREYVVSIRVEISKIGVTYPNILAEFPRILENIR